MSKTTDYFENTVVEDIDHIETIGTMAIPAIYHDFKIKMKTPAVPISIYSVVFDCIMKHLKSLQKTKESHTIIIANRLEVGFTTSFAVKENEDLEKFGNFMPYIKHIENDKLTEVDEEEEKSVVRCTQWNESNITTSVTDVKEITKMAVDRIARDLDLQGANPEIVMPVFCTVHDKIVEYMKLKRAEIDKWEFRINMAGCYDIYARLMEDGVEISYKPCVYSKGMIKEDGDATSEYE